MPGKTGAISAEKPFPKETRISCSVEHHERQPPIAFQPILQMEIDDRFFLPQLQPEIAGNPTVVLVDATVTLPPVVELAGGHAQPMNESSDAALGLLRPAPDEIHNLVPHVMRYPVAGQSSQCPVLSCSA